MKRIKTMCIGLIAVVLLTACGASNNQSYIIATDTTYPPFEWTNEKGELVGIDIEILKAIAEDQKITFDIQSVGFSAALGLVESGQADGIMAGMTITEERSKKYDFATPYYDVTVTMAVNKDSGVKTYEDLRGKKVALKTATNGADFAESIKDQYGFEVVYFTDSPTMYAEVAAGNAVACFEDTPVMAYSIQTGVNLVLSGIEEAGSSYGFAILKGTNPDLLKAFNDGFENIVKNGKYQEIVDKYTK